MEISNLARGNVGASVGRKKSTVERRKHMLTFTDDEWLELRKHSGGERKISKFIVEMLEDFKEDKLILENKYRKE